MKKFLALLAVAVAAAFAAPAFAAVNPFADLPQGHWAYDAVAELASRGIISGYPDGVLGGARPATRYEAASVVARALAVTDAEKANKQDLELLKKLVEEFKDELSALGVRAEDVDKRVASLEEDLGGWKINGAFIFDAKFGDSDGGSYLFSENGARNEFEKDQFRLYLTKRLSNDSYFFAEYRTGGDGAGDNSTGLGDMQHMSWAQIYIDTKLPWGIGMRAGRFTVDFEDDYGLYSDNDAIFGDYRLDGFRLEKRWDTLALTAVVGRNEGFGIEAEEGDYMNYIADLSWQPNENLFLGATAYLFNGDSGKETAAGDVAVYGFYAGYSFTPAIQLKGIYYAQELDEEYMKGAGIEGGDSPKAWKAILDVKQDLLKLASLWVEYSRQDNNFLAYNDRYAIGGNTYDYAGYNMDYADAGGESEWWFVRADRQWNDRWSSFVRFASVDFDTAGLDDATEWGVGVGFQYTPALYFELSYDLVDHGDGSVTNEDAANGKESVVRFRTSLEF